MFSRMLVGTDGSDSAAKAVAQSVALAKALGAELIVLHSYPIAKSDAGGPFGGGEGVPTKDIGVSILQDVQKRYGGEAKLKSCGTVYTGAFQTQAVAWYMHLHEMDSEIFAYPPGTTIAPSFSSLSRDPRFPAVARTKRWMVGSTCNIP